MKNVYAKFAATSVVSVLLCLPLVAQGVLISNSPGTPDPSAGLEIKYNNAGFLLPRMTTVERNAIANPAIGLQIFNTTTLCLQMYYSTGWRDVSCECSSFPSASFSVSPLLIGTGSPATFSSANTPGVSYAWSFTSGNPGTSVNATANATWSSAGTYAVSLTATDNNGCSATTTQNITVQNCGVVTGTANFSFTGSPQFWVVPSCVTSVSVDVYGASGGYGTSGGRGGRVQAQFPVNPGDTLHIFVGGQGIQTGSSTPAPGGYNGGGSVLAATHTNAFGSGGGASDIRRGGTGLNNRIIVAGGGGGSYGDSGQGTGSQGGHGGGLTGGNGGANCSVPGFGGTQSAGGAGGGVNGCGCSGDPRPGNPGTLGQGGNAPQSCCFSGTNCNGGTIVAGAGGGGYYGGGSGGTYSAGGGGSSFTFNGATNVTHTQGVRSGNGQITLTW